MYFVLSTGRAGSRSIATALDQLPGTVCRHHPKPELAAEATAFHLGEYSREELTRILKETRPETVEGEVYGEVALQHTLLFPILREIFPEAQYIWLIRDGRDSVASMYYRGWYDEIYPKQGLMWRQARLHGDSTGDFSEAEWNAMSRFAKCCWCWSKYNHLIEDALKGLGEDMATRVRLDRLTSSIPRLQSFLGLSGDQKILVEQLNTARQPVSYWSRWTASQRQIFEEFCGEDMTRWFPEWRSPSGIWRDLASQPVHRPGKVENLVRSGRTTAEKVMRKLGVGRLAGRG